MESIIIKPCYDIKFIKTSKLQNKKQQNTHLGLIHIIKIQPINSCVVNLANRQVHTITYGFGKTLPIYACKDIPLKKCMLSKCFTS